MNGKHSPGPWRVRGDFKTDGGRKCSTLWIIESRTRKCMATLEVLELNTRPNWRAAHPEAVAEHAETLLEVEANAQLMAAAPDLRDLLQELAECPAGNHSQRLELQAKAKAMLKRLAESSR